MVRSWARRMGVVGVLVMGMALVAPSIASAATKVVAGTVVAGGGASSQPVPVSGSGALTARLLWPEPASKATLRLQRGNGSGGWTTVASASSTVKPVLLSYGSVVTGPWRVQVVPVSGTVAYTLEVSYPGTAPPTAPPFLTLLFSRTGMHGASSCTRNDTNIVPMSTVSATLAADGLLTSGTVQTETTKPSAQWCGHYGRTLFPSWDDLAALRDQYGWTFVSHARHRSDHLPDLTPEEQWDEVCGSQVDLTAHGHTRADGLFAYPNNRYTDALQADYAARCYAFGRRYGNGVTTRVSGTAAPFWQSTAQVIGGRCRDTTLVCSNLSSIHVSYTLPSEISARFAALGNDQWYTLQSYVLVSGSQSGSWNCNGPVTTHWSTDAERYCWNDYKQILATIPTARIIVTDAKTVADAWGRTQRGRPTTRASGPAPRSLSLDPVQPAIAAAQVASRYQLSVLPSPSGAAWVAAEAIDDADRVSGGAKISGHVHALSWSAGGTLTDLTPGFAAAFAYDTASGKTVGYRAATSRSLPVLFTGSTPTALTLPPGTQSGHAAGIGPTGTIAGDAASGTGYRATIWSGASLTPRLLSGFAGATARNAFARDSNAANTIIGAAQTPGGRLHASVWQTPTTGAADLGTLGGSDSTALAINGAGTIVGAADTSAATTHAAVWQPVSGGYAAAHDLGTLYPASDSQALAINTAGLIVGASQVPFPGTSYIVGDSPTEAVAWDTSGIHRLASLTANLPSGWIITSADCINSAGDIAVTLQAPNGSTAAGILRPTA